MANEIYDLDVDEVSLVDKGANRKRFLVIKNEDGTSEATETENVSKWLEAERVAKWLEAENIYEWLEAEKAAAPADNGDAAGEEQSPSLPVEVADVIRSAIEALQAVLDEDNSPEPPAQKAADGEGEEAEEQPTTTEKGEGEAPEPEPDRLARVEKIVGDLAEVISQGFAGGPPFAVRKSIQGQEGPPQSKDNWPGFRLPPLGGCL